MSLNGSPETNVNWSTVKPKPEKIYHGRGVMPYIPGTEEAMKPHYTNINNLIDENNTNQVNFENNANQLNGENNMHQFNVESGSNIMYYPPYVNPSQLDSGYLSNPFIDQCNSETLMHQQYFTNSYLGQWSPNNFPDQNFYEWFSGNLSYSNHFQFNSKDFPSLHPYQESSKEFMNIQTDQLSAPQYRNPHSIQGDSDNLKNFNQSQTSRKNSKEPKTNKMNRRNSVNPNLIQIQPEKTPKSDASLNLDQKPKDCKTNLNLLEENQTSKTIPDLKHQGISNGDNFNCDQITPKNKASLNIEQSAPISRKKQNIQQKSVSHKMELDQKIKNNEKNIPCNQEVLQKSTSINHNQSNTLSHSGESKVNHKYSNQKTITNKLPLRKFVRTPFLRQKEIDKLKEQVNVVENENLDLPKNISNEVFNNFDESNANGFIPTYDFEYPNIIASVREATGGRNVQSNEAIEERHKQRQKVYIEKQEVDQSSSNESYITASDESFKTAFSFEQFQAFQESLNEKILNESNVDRHKNNALILGLLKNTQGTDDPDYIDEISESDRDDSWTDAVADVHSESNVVENIVNDVQNLQLDNIHNELDEATLMRGDRLGRFLFQSEEDEDVYVHPLREKIQKDPEWQKVTLRRKGIERIFSPREYYLNLNDEDFDFQMPPK
ncbi:uncharacterized protein MAL13P1.336-like [Copidosoma floridanum]|uniref:uncharacterized protein MAL13P1.336-like n=1 Tax=Copidosoma floridanum TaxID=29053 RepID=UPI0006C9D5D3|nr:uncharacterized protein MAL13P1.336-like [Copidosoma floridanum]